MKTISILLIIFSTCINGKLQANARSFSGEKCCTSYPDSLMAIKSDSIELPLQIRIYPENKPIFTQDPPPHEESVISAEKVPSASKSATAAATTVDAGSTSGVLDVSSTGAAGYAIPLTVPSGLGNVVPQIAIAYNSQAGNGIAGYGWSITGLSTISRVPSTLFHDNAAGGVNFDRNDRFALDGQRLLLKSGTYGGNGSEYQTENYSNVKIVSRGVSPYGASYGPEYFEVFYPDGSKALYGVTSNSRTPFEYAITYTENPLGARINYIYTPSNNVLLISEINYGKVGASSGPCQVLFTYTTAARGDQAYIGGQSFYRNQLLNNVVVKSVGTAVRKYKLSYETVNLTNYQRLISFQEFDGSESHSLPAIQFSYNSSTDYVSRQTITNLSLSGIASHNAQVVTADFTGNGSMDFLVYPTSKDKFWAFYDLEPGSPNMQLGYEVSTGQFVDIMPATWLTHNNKQLPGAGVFVVKKNSNDTFKFEVLSAGTVQPVYYQYERSWNNPTNAPDFMSECYGFMKGAKLDYIFLSGDFDGNGLTDIVAINKPKSYAYADLMGYPYPNECTVQYTTLASSAYLINMDRRVTANYVTNLGTVQTNYESYYEQKFYTGDFNGDGKTDILGVQGGTLRVYCMVNNALQVLWQGTYPDIYENMLVLLGDYNGDGKTDVIYSKAWDSSKFITLIATGTGFVSFDGTMPFTNYRNKSTGGLMQNQYDLIASDVDGDGKTDIISSLPITISNSSNGAISIYVFHNSTVSANSQPTFTTGASASFSGNLRHYPIPIFLNPDRLNQKLELAYISDNAISSFRFNKDQRTDSQLSSILNDGLTQTITYKPLVTGIYSDNVRLYQNGQNQVYPYVDLPGATGMSVVSKITKSGGGQSVSQVFGYEEGVTHMEGLGFMGFGRLIRSNWLTSSGDANRLYTISVHNPQLRGAATSTFTSKNASINPALLATTLSSPPPETGLADGASQYDYISRSDISWKTLLLPNKVFVNVPAATSSKDMLSGTFSTQAIEYDAYYNKVKTTGNFSGHGNQVQEFTYDNSTGSPYYIGRLKSSQATVNNGTSSYSSKEEYTYTESLPTQIKRKGNGTDYTTEELIYDMFGNITQRDVYLPDGNHRGILMNYDDSGRFLKKTTEPDGTSSSVEYNPVDGTLVSQTNLFKQTKRNTYDVWGRLATSTNYVGDVVTTITYQKDANNNTIVNQYDSEGRSSTSVINCWGQTIQTQTKNIFGQILYKAFQYDAYGRKTAESEPAQSGLVNQWNLIEYDEYDRVKKSTSFTGQVTSYSYSGLSTTVNDGTKSVITTNNALGHTISVQDPGGTINYTYFANGGLKSADYGGISQTLEQDGWGRRTKLNDPSAGQYQYQYDGFNQLVKEISPKGTTDYVYNRSGKVIQKRISGDNTNIRLDYIYYPPTGLLTSYTLTNADGNNATYSYSYDDQKRISSVTEDNLHARFITSYTYNNNNRVATESHQATNKSNNITVSKTVEMQYRNGQLAQVTLQGSGKVLWVAQNTDIKGRINKFGQASVLTTNLVFDDYGLPQQQSVVQTSGSQSNLITIGYNFNSQRGLLNTRTNSAFGWSENYTYDNLDRLTYFNDNTGNHSHTYDNRGRILNFSDLGDYSYQDNSYRQSELALTPSADAIYRSLPLLQTTYNSFKSPVSIYEQGRDRISFQYNAGLERSHMYWGGEQEDMMQRPFRRHYSEDGAVEITEDLPKGKTSFIFYLGGDAYTAASIWKEVYISGNQSDQKLYFLHRDHLRSIVLITNEQGEAVEKRQFDAWGNLIKLTDGNGNNLSAFIIFDRGYTGHEHLLSVGLIHMNGRLYDPRLHRFLSPDNYVQDLYNSQNFNRYSYAMNNPLSFVDENGEFLHLIIGAFVGGVINWVAHGADFSWKGLGYFATGAAAGALGAGVGSGMSSLLGGGGFGAGFWGTSAAKIVGSGFLSGAVVGAAGGAASGFALNFGNTLVDGGSLGGAFKSAAVGGVMGGLTGGALGGLFGGIDAAMDGRKFWSGAGTSQDGVALASNGNPNDWYSSTDEMRADYNSNIGSVDKMSLEDIETKLKTKVMLADNTNTRGNYAIREDGMLRNVDKPNSSFGGVTTKVFSGGAKNQIIHSDIVMAPGLKGFSLNVRNMVFKHEFMHAWHHFAGFAGFDSFSERATSTFSYAYSKAYGFNWLLDFYRPNLKPYPNQFSWRHFAKIIPLWIR